jgi:hypothetical protein
MKSQRKIRKMQNFCSQFANGQYFADSNEIDRKYAVSAAD